MRSVCPAGERTLMLAERNVCIPERGGLRIVGLSSVTGSSSSYIGGKMSFMVFAEPRLDRLPFVVPPLTCFLMSTKDLMTLVSLVLTVEVRRFDTRLLFRAAITAPSRRIILWNMNVSHSCGAAAYLSVGFAVPSLYASGPGVKTQGIPGPAGPRETGVGAIGLTTQGIPGPAGPRETGVGAIGLTTQGIPGPAGSWAVTRLGSTAGLISPGGVGGYN